jgi:hypothetical protein
VSPPRSPTIVGSAVATIVWSSDASSTTRISAPKITRTRCAGSCGGVLTPQSYQLALSQSQQNVHRQKGKNRASGNEERQIRARRLQGHACDREIENRELEQRERREHTADVPRLAVEAAHERRAYGRVDDERDSKCAEPQLDPQRVEGPAALMDEDEAKGERTERTWCEDPRPEPFAERADPFAKGGVGMKPQQP